LYDEFTANQSGWILGIIDCVTVCRWDGPSTRGSFLHGRTYRGSSKESRASCWREAL